jgi:hypothetical protein
MAERSEAPSARRRPRIGRFLLRAVSVLFGGLVALGVVLAIRLSRGPIDLDFLTPYLADALGTPDGAWRASIGGTQLAWDSEEDDLDLAVLDVELTARDGGTIASVPRLSVRFRVAPLFRGELRLRSVDVIEPRLTVRRNADGAFEVSAGERKPSAEGHTALLPTPEQGGPEDIEIRHGEVTVEDAMSGLSARLGDAHVEIHWTDSRLAIDGTGGVELGTQTVPVRLVFERDGRGPATVEALVDPVSLASVGDWLSACREVDADDPRAEQLAAIHRLAVALRRVRLPASAQLHADLDPSLRPTRASISLHAGKGSVEVPAPVGLGVALAKGKARVEWEGSDGSVSLESLALDLGGPTVSATGRRDASGTLTATASLRRLPVADLGRYWPPTAAEGARTWLTSNLSAGRVDEATMRLTAVVPSAGDAALKTLDGQVAFSGLTVRYLDTMPPATGVTGRGTFDVHAWRLKVASGRVGDISIAPGSVTITKIEQPGTRLDVKTDVRGPLASVLATLDHPPLRVADHLGVDPARTSGQVTGTLGIGVHLDDRPRKHDVDVEARATLAHGALPGAIGDWAITDAALEVAVRDDDVSVKGPLRLGGVPLRAEVHEVLGAPALRRLTVTSRTTAREMGGLGFDVSEWADGPLDLEVVLAAASGDKLLVSVDPTRARLTMWPIGLEKAPGVPASMTATLVLVDHQLREIAPARLVVGKSVVAMRAAREADGRWRTVEANAYVAQPTGDVEYALVATPTGTRHDVRFRCSDAAALLRAMGRDVRGIGGALTFTGQIGLDVPGLPLNGHIEVGQVTVTRSPLLSALLNVASLQGILDTFRKGGLVFKDASLDLVREGSTVRLRDVLAHGQYLVITGQGTIDAGALALRGTLVPSYFGINRGARRIPVIGQILTGRSGEGIAAIDFRIDGTADHPRVHVSPSSLGPGIVRDLLRKISG